MYPFKEGQFAVRNGWYVGAFAHEVKHELLSRWILNEPVVFFRKEDGEAVALSGRCPHRHFPLGKSCLKGDTIQCAYHGITFGADGDCVRIPSQKVVPGVYRIKKYPLVERGMWLWIWPGDPALADESLLPDLKDAGFLEPEFRYRPFYYLDIAGRYQLLNDNLLDLTHLAYLHASSIGVEENASTPEERTQTDRVIRSRRVMRKVAQSDFMKGTLGFEGPVDRTTGMSFYLPGFHAGIDYTSVPSDHPTRGGERLRTSHVFHAVTPGLKNTTHYFFSMGGLMTEADLDYLYGYLRSVVEEDAFATTEIEHILGNLEYVPDELMLRSDTTAVLGRRALQSLMEKEGQL